MRELRTIPHRPRILVLVGKGHNGGDALVATKRLLKTIPTARAVVWSTCPWKECRPLCRRAYEEATKSVGKRMEEVENLQNLCVTKEIESVFTSLVENSGFSASIDGILGMGVKLPIQQPLFDLFTLINQSDAISVRAAVDLPSGMTEDSDANALRADFTYATGVVKVPLVEPGKLKWTGRVRYVDLGLSLIHI